MKNSFITHLTLFFAFLLTSEISFAKEQDSSEMRLGTAMTFQPLYSYEQELPTRFDKGNFSYFITSNKVVKEYVAIEELKDSPLFCEVEFSSYGNIIDPYSWNYEAVNASENMGTLFYNTYYELEKIGKIKPYANIGFGMAWTGIRGDSALSGMSDASKLAWNAGFGFDFTAKEDVIIDVGYRYSDLNTSSENDFMDTHLAKRTDNIHQLVFNVEYIF